MLVDVIAGLVEGAGDAAGHVVIVEPAPVLGPQMERQVVDVPTPVGFDEAAFLIGAASAAFVATRDEMLWIEGLDEARGLVHPTIERREHVVASVCVVARARFV